MGAVGGGDAVRDGVILPALTGPGPVDIPQATEGRVLALGLGGEAVGDARLGGEPLAVGDRVEPAHAHDGLIGGVEALVVPETRGASWPVARKGSNRAFVTGRDGYAEGRDLDAMDGLLVGAAAFAAHQQHTAVEAHQLGLGEGDHAARSYGGVRTPSPGRYAVRRAVDRLHRRDRRNRLAGRSGRPRAAHRRQGREPRTALGTGVPGATGIRGGGGGVRGLRGGARPRRH